MSPSEQNENAQKRILNVLHTYLYCCEKQLESKICESGPGDLRPVPHVLANALTELVRIGPVIAEERDGTKFYYRADRFHPNNSMHVQRRERIVRLHSMYRSLAQSAYSHRLGRSFSSSVHLFASSGRLFA